MKAAVSGLAACLALAVSFPQTAAACSWSYKRGYSPEEIKERNDVFIVRGTFRFEETLGEPGVDEEGQEVLVNPEVIGHVERGQKVKFKTIHVPATQFATCMFPGNGPEADATGKFWISNHREQGRFRILAWEGEYLPTEPAKAEPTD